MDKDTFVARIEAKADSLYRVAWAILTHNDDVADALQETALRAWQHRHQLRHEEDEAQAAAHPVPRGRTGSIDAPAGHDAFPGPARAAGDAASSADAPIRRGHVLP